MQKIETLANNFIANQKYRISHWIRDFCLRNWYCLVEFVCPQVLLQNTVTGFRCNCELFFGICESTFATEKQQRAVQPQRDISACSTRQTVCHGGASARLRTTSYEQMAIPDDYASTLIMLSRPLPGVVGAVFCSCGLQAQQNFPLFLLLTVTLLLMCFFGKYFNGPFCLIRSPPFILFSFLP